MDFVYILRVLLKRKWIILGAALLASGLAYFLTRNQPKSYRSSTQISTGYAIKDEVQVNEQFDPWAADTKFNNVVVDFTSPTVLSLLGYQLMLHDLNSPTPFRKLDAKQKESAIYKAVKPEEVKRVLQTNLDSIKLLTSYKPEDNKLINYLNLYGYGFKSLSGVNVFRVQRTDYLEVDYSSENPELSAFVVNNVFQQFLRYYKSVRQTTNTESIDTLRSIMEKKKQVVDLKNVLLNKFTGVDEGYGQTTLDMATDLQSKMGDERSKKTQKEYELKRVQQKLAALSTGTTTVKTVDNSDLLAAKKASNEAYTAFLENPGNKALEDKYKRLSAEYQDKFNLYNSSKDDPDNTTGKPLESKAELLDKKLDLENEIQGLTQSIAAYQTQINELTSTATSLAKEGQTVESLKKERDLANQEYLDAQKRYSTAMDISGSSVNNFRQTVIGQPALEPEPSKRKMIVGMAGAAVMVTTILIIIFLTFLDTSIKTPLIFSKTVNLKLISLVNFMDLKNKNIEDIVANNHHLETVSDRNKFNTFRESIRKLRYEIENTGKKIFLFTSTKKGQGKTTLIQALSYSMSLSKKKILIIDTNFCNPDLTAQLKADPILEKMGAHKANGVTVLEEVKKLSKNIGEGTIYAIGAEGGDYTPSEILPRENILKHLQSLKGEFDYIFLEGPPLNDFSDSKELTQYVEGVIVVFSATHIIKQIDKQSISFFKDLNGKFCGSILNMVDLKNVNVI